ncbi:MAG TPA: dimethylargininase [Planctomycetota bacterium]|nr:dimethylargininase [Planctomycetota bacterium]
MTLALLHTVTPSLARCELTFVGRRPIDVARARRQHGDYGRLLAGLGAAVREVNTSPDHADAVFIEDCVVVLDELAVLTSMGAPSRRAEVDRLLPVLAGYREIVRIEPPATLEGGDVLRIARTLFVGRSPRTNQAGIDALAGIAAPLGYDVVAVPVHGCLHLKTAVTALAPDTLLANLDWFDPAPFGDRRIVAVDAHEPFAANTLRIGEAVVMSASHARTIARVREAGFAVHTVAIDELEKAEAGVTCLSVLLPDR